MRKLYHLASNNCCRNGLEKTKMASLSFAFWNISMLRYYLMQCLKPFYTSRLYYCKLKNHIVYYSDWLLFSWQRFWIAITVVNLEGCAIQTILLYKAYICYDRSILLLILGSLINLGYIALIFIFAAYGKVPTYKDIIGNCIVSYILLFMSFFINLFFFFLTLAE